MGFHDELHADEAEHDGADQAADRPAEQLAKQEIQLLQTGQCGLATGGEHGRTGPWSVRKMHAPSRRFIISVVPMGKHDEHRCLYDYHQPQLPSY